RDFHVTGVQTCALPISTQWLFHGHPKPASDPLQVAVARLVGYCWPAESDETMELADEARTWIARCKELSEHTDDDGILCLPSVRSEERRVGKGWGCRWA